MRNIVLRLEARLPQENDLKRGCERYLDMLTERLDRVAMGLDAQKRLLTQTAGGKLASAQTELARLRPRFAEAQIALARSEENLIRRLAFSIQDKRTRLEALAASLNALDVSKTLARGFTLTTDKNGHVVCDAGRLAQGERVRLHFVKGSAQAEVLSVDRE